MYYQSESESITGVTPLKRIVLRFIGTGLGPVPEERVITPLLQTTELPVNRELIGSRRLSLAGLDLCVLFADERGDVREVSLPVYLQIPEAPPESVDDGPDPRNYWWKQPRIRQRRGW